MNDDPLDKVFLTPEQRLKIYLSRMPDDLVPVFLENFQRIKPHQSKQEAREEYYTALGFKKVDLES